MLVVIYSLSAPMSRRRNKPQRLIVADSVDREPGQLHDLFERIFHECLLQKYLLAYKTLSRALWAESFILEKAPRSGERPATRPRKSSLSRAIRSSNMSKPPNCTIRARGKAVLR